MFNIRDQEVNHSLTIIDESKTIVKFGEKYNCQYHLSSSVRKWQNAFQLDNFHKALP
jgi:hypothetical protein